MDKPNFSKTILSIPDLSGTCNIIVNKLRDEILDMRRKGAVIGISGGIDSSVTLALSVRAFGSENVLGIIMPERDSNPDSAVLATELANKFNVKTITEDITSALDGFGCYKRRDEAVKKVFPDYSPASHKMKIGIKQNPAFQDLPPVFSLSVIDSNGVEKSKILPGNEYLQIVAASNFKQRCRMSLLYYHAERMHYAVIGTPNKHEVDQGFFVKYGDGGADIMPIGNLYKTQVFELAKFLGVPESIQNRTPTTDTYPAEQTQEEFFYQMPFYEMDLLWFAYENSYDIERVAEVMGKTEQEIVRIFSNFKRKKQTTEYLRKPPIHFY